VDDLTTNYTLDLNNRFTQVLADGTNTYLYGTARIAQYDAGGAEYFLTDALGSVRQLVDNAGGVQLSKVYEPFGGGLNSSGAGATNYGFTGEWTDPTGLVHLRARYYAPGVGRLITKDSWQGNPNRPMSLNYWLYVYGNPINLTDPTGNDGYCDSPYADPIDCGWYDPDPPTNPKPQPYLPLPGFCNNPYVPPEECLGICDNIDPKPPKDQLPPVSPPPGTRWVNLTPSGNGAVSWYDYPEVDNPKVLYPKELNLDNSPHDQVYYTVQGSVKLNGQIWNYVLSSGSWKKNEWGAGCNPPYASYSWCVVPFQYGSSNRPATGAVLKNGRVPMSKEARVYVRVPDDPTLVFSNGLLVNTRDECPGCSPLQVDVLSLGPLITFNTKGGYAIKVYIWAAIPK
jgi:RHS repeat-associated protein